jgi:myo-inositol-1-phosphate synthase
MSDSYLNVDTSKTHIDGQFLNSEYVYEKHFAHVEENGRYAIKCQKLKYNLRTDLRVPKTGLMLVGWGGNKNSLNYILTEL